MKKKTGKSTKKKNQSAGALAEKVAVRLQLLRRLEWSDDNGYVSCCSCGVTRHYKDKMQGGHYISRGRSATKLEESNINPQCASCNFKMGKGDSLVFENYRQWMVETYGEEEIQRLKSLVAGEWKWSKPDLEEKLMEINARIREQEARVCG
jgi:hypothetical protein